MERTYLHRCAAVTNPLLVSVWHCQADARPATATFCISTFAWVSDVRAQAWPESPGLGFKARA